MLYECHGHVMMDGLNYKEAAARHREGVSEKAVREALRGLHNAGVTYFREGGDPFGASLLAARLAPEYGIEYRSPVFAIHKKGTYGGIVGRAYEDLSEFLSLVREAKKLGADFIKVMLSGIIDFDNYGVITGTPREREHIKELISIAHGEGFSVMAHVNTAEAVLAAAEAGLDSVEHGCYVNKECIAAMREHNVIWVPTIAAVNAFVGREGFSATVPQEILETHMENVKKAVLAGVTVAPGSDSGAVGVPHGRGAEDEYRLLAMCGITKEAADRAGEEVRRRFVRQ